MNGCSDEIKKKASTELPTMKTEWQSNSNQLTPEQPVTLSWTNKDNVTFKINFTVDQNYMFEVNQEIQNDSDKTLEPFPTIIWKDNRFRPKVKNLKGRRYVYLDDYLKRRSNNLSYQ